MYRNIFAERLQSLMATSGLTQAQIAERVGVKPQIVTDYKGKRATPSFDVLTKLADLLGVSLDYLVGRSDDPKVHKPRKREG